LKTSLLGAFYGAVLSALGVAVAGAGHGTYFLLILVSSPAGLLGVASSVIGAPILWFVIGLLFNRRNPRFVLLAVLLLHYGSAVFLLVRADENWQYFARVWHMMPLVLLGGFVWYMAGQIVIWVMLFRRNDRRKAFRDLTVSPSSRAVK
jgi:hypothetical protein